MEEIIFLEGALKEFRRDEQLAPTRKLIQTQFKDFVDDKLKSEEKSTKN